MFKWPWSHPCLWQPSFPSCPATSELLPKYVMNLSLFTRRTLGVVCVALISLYLLLYWRNSKPTAAKPPGAPAFQRTVVAVGDLHGDYPNMVEVLQMSGVVSKNGSWTRNADYFVQTGDIVDRCVHTCQTTATRKLKTTETLAHEEVMIPSRCTATWKT